MSDEIQLAVLKRNKKRGQVDCSLLICLNRMEYFAVR